jgi:hypothetical protein
MFCSVISQNTRSHETYVLASDKWTASVEVQEVSLCFRGSGNVLTCGNRLPVGRTQVTIATLSTGRLYTTPATLELDPVICSKARNDTVITQAKLAGTKLNIADGDVRLMTTWTSERSVEHIK